MFEIVTPAAFSETRDSDPRNPEDKKMMCGSQAALVKR